MRKSKPEPSRTMIDAAAVRNACSAHHARICTGLVAAAMTRYLLVRLLVRVECGALTERDSSTFDNAESDISRTYTDRASTDMRSTTLAASLAIWLITSALGSGCTRSPIHAMARWRNSSHAAALCTMCVMLPKGTIQFCSFSSAFSAFFASSA